MRAAVPVLCLFVLLGYPVPGLANTPLERAREASLAGNRSTAKALLDSVLTGASNLDPESRLDAEYLRATFEEDGFRYEERLRSLLSAEQREKRQSVIRLALGHLAFARGDLAGALVDFQAARTGGGDEASFWHGLTAFALGDAGAAREALKEAAGSGDKSLRHRALIVMGDTHRMAARWDEAAKVYRKVRGDAPAGSGWWSTAVLHEAACLEASGDPEAAAGLLQLVIAQAPGGYDAPVAHARLREQLDFASSVPGEEAAGEGVFALQVGAFAVKGNAESLAERVRGAGFKPVRVATRDDALFRVLVGTYQDRAGAEAAGDSVSAAMGLGYSVVQGSR